MTEDVSQRFADIDLWSSKDIIEALYEGQLMALAAIQPALSQIALAAEDAASALGDRGRLIYVGAGTSGRLALQDGVELTPTFGWPQERMIFCMAGGTAALTSSVEGAEDDIENGAEKMREANVGKNDVVFAVAASGNTPFTVSALKEAKGRGALTIGISNNPGTPLLAAASHPILLETGSELIAGSTRMKAGTTQKIVLNMISTAIMTRLGRVYKGYMVDMIAANKKLEARAINMVCDIAGCSSDMALSSLTAADQNIKKAILIALGESHESSEQLLAQAGGNLRQALKHIKSSYE